MNPLAVLFCDSYESITIVFSQIVLFLGSKTLFHSDAVLEEFVHSLRRLRNTRESSKTDGKYSILQLTGDCSNKIIAAMEILKYTSNR